MATAMMTGLVVALYVLTHITDVNGVLDFTCLVSKPRIDITGHDGLYIGGYKSGDDADASISFGRVTYTGTGSGLPRSSYLWDHPYASAKRLYMPSSDGVHRIGAFYCEAHKEGIRGNIPAIILASNSVITPDRITQTVNVGESVTLSVTTTLTDLRWSHNGSDFIENWNGRKRVEITNVEVKDGGIYECYERDQREHGQHAILQLSVRACRSSRWGLPDCTYVCPVCFNGGICDERSGVCVCAPGFSGHNCRTVHGTNRFGKDGQVVCSRNDPHSTACRGFLFCLLHPYGCSCAAGFHGIDCDQACPQGTYGANCLSESHCNEGISCLPDTGECSDGRCRPGWYGVNCQEKKGIIDMTCFVSRSTVPSAGDDATLKLGGYKSGADTDIEVTFGRPTFTGTGTGLPDGSTKENHFYGHHVAELLELPASLGNQRIGAFLCQTTKYGTTERIIATILSSTNRYATPNRISITASVGENVTLSVTTTANIEPESLRWRKKNLAPMWFGEKSHTITNVAVDDAGVYECHTEDRNGNHAIMQLIVRACPTGRWRRPSCSRTCPSCYNGGICDDRSGLCVCAPGFSGTICKSVHGSNRWGQDGQLTCSRLGPHSPACRGRLFCLPHPYGCTCAAGFHGIDCDQDCEDGTYGANCQSECRCAEGVSCLPDTGECSGGRCRPGWYGVNCQERCPHQEPEPVTGLNVQVSSTVISVRWEPESEPGPCSYFVLSYDVSNNVEQCQTRQHQERVLTSTNFEISDLQYFSTYEISVKIRRNGAVSSVTVTTKQREPSAPPSNISISVVTSDTLTFQWSEPPCGTRHGEIVSYSFILSNDTGTVVKTGSSSSSDVTIGNLTPFTRYMFQVAAATSAGAGPLSEDLPTSTKQSVPSVSRHLRIVEVTRYSINITWESPEHVHGGVIEGYSVEAKIVNKPYDGEFVEKADSDIEQYINNTAKRAYQFLNLLPSTKYQVKVFAYNACGKGPGSNIAVFTNMVTSDDISKPRPLSPIPEELMTSTTVKITIPQSESVYVTGYQIGVELKSTIQKRQTQQPLVSETVSDRFYVAAEISKSDIEGEGLIFMVGDNKQYRMYSNTPLSAGQTYMLYTAYVSRFNNTVYTVSSWSDGTDVTTMPPQKAPSGLGMNTWIVAVLASLLCISAVFLVATSVVLRSKTMQLRSKTTQLKSKTTQLRLKITQLRSLTTQLNLNPKQTNASCEQIQMSPDEYVEYNNDNLDSTCTYQDIDEMDKPMAQIEDVYEDIPALIPHL